MKRLIYIIPITAISLLTLTGCNKAEQSTTSQTPSAIGETKVSGSLGAAQEGLKALGSVVSNTKAAVETGKFNKAQQEFDKFENVWAKVEDGVKTKSAKTYNAIEDAATQVKGALKAKNKAKALKELKVLDTSIATVSKK